jgi:hypothetical protein
MNGNTYPSSREYTVESTFILPNPKKEGLIFR